MQNDRFALLPMTHISIVIASAAFSAGRSNLIVHNVDCFVPRNDAQVFGLLRFRSMTSFVINLHTIFKMLILAMTHISIVIASAAFSAGRSNLKLVNH